MKARLRHPHGDFDSETFYHIDTIDCTREPALFTLRSGRKTMTVSEQEIIEWKRAE